MATIIPTTFHRRGEVTTRFGQPDMPPEALVNYPFPKSFADRLKAADKAADALYTAHEAWRDAHEEWETFAPATDQKALVDAIRAGKPDPGTPHTDAADRAEHVAWTRLQLAIDDSRGSINHADVIRDYLAEHADDLATHEVKRKAAHEEADEKARAIMREAEAGCNKPGTASAAMKQYVATRWTDGDDHDTLLTPREGATAGQRQAIAERNQRIIERWKREANGEPEPAHDLRQAKAGELTSAAEYGSTEARNELARRKAASEPAARP